LIVCLSQEKDLSGLLAVRDDRCLLRPFETTGNLLRLFERTFFEDLS
jgi:hypothetical protein